MENIEGNSIGEMVINITNILKEIGVNKDDIKVFVIPTNEELEIARQAFTLVNEKD